MISLSAVVNVLILGFASIVFPRFLQFPSNRPFFNVPERFCLTAQPIGSR